jgi:hypothetical protein
LTLSIEISPLIQGRDVERKRVEAMEKEWREKQACLLAKV